MQDLEQPMEWTIKCDTCNTPVMQVTVTKSVAGIFLFLMYCESCKKKRFTPGVVQ